MSPDCMSMDVPSIDLKVQIVEAERLDEAQYRFAEERVDSVCRSILVE